MIQQNDAAGGAGSLKSDLLGIFVNGLSRVVDGKLSQKYPLTSFNDNVTVNAAGDIKNANAPQADPTSFAAVKPILSNPYVIAGGVALVVTLIAVVALSRR